MSSNMLAASARKQPLKTSLTATAKANVQVAIRVRPQNSKEKGDTLCVKIEPSSRAVAIRNKNFGGFDQIYGPASTQIQLYKELVAPQIEDVIKGYNCTVFAYGQTGTGKTFTMEGGEGCLEGDWATDPNTGIIPRAVQHIFTLLESREELCEFVVRVSYVEIYNEEMIDLLGSKCDDAAKIRIFEDPAKKGAVLLSGVEEASVRCRDDVYKLLKLGAERRRTAETLMNQRSSRSHSVFTITVLIRESTPAGEELVKQGKLRLVDLAGSENIGRSGAEGKRAKEAGNINQSLLTLGRVITALTSNAPHIPYRESKLTRLLQDSLGGSTITTIIATLSPVNANFEESLSTLEYAHRAKNIKNHPEINQKLSRKDVFKEYAGEIERLRRDLKAAREKNGVYIDEEEYDGMERKITTQEERIAELEEEMDAILEKMARYMEDMQLMDASYKAAYGRVRKLEERLAMRIDELEETKVDLAREKAEHERTQLALSRSRLHADDAFHTAERTKACAFDAQVECGQLHARADAIIEIANENGQVNKELASSISGSVVPMREANKENAQKAHFTVTEARQAMDGLSSIVPTDVSQSHSSIDEMLETMKSLVANWSIADEHVKDTLTQDGEQVTKTVDDIKNDISAALLATIEAVKTKTGEMESRIDDLLKENGNLDKEMDALRASCRDAIATAQAARAQARDEYEAMSKAYFDEMASYMQSMQQSCQRWAERGLAERDASEAAERDADDAVTTVIGQMTDVHMGYNDQVDELCAGVKEGLKEIANRVDADNSSCIPKVESAASVVVDHSNRTNEAMNEWAKRKEVESAEKMDTILSATTTAKTAIDHLDSGHTATQVAVRAALDTNEALLDEMESSTEANLTKLNGDVNKFTSRIRSIPPKDVVEVYREFDDNPTPPTEEILFADEDTVDEEENEEDEKENDMGEMVERSEKKNKIRRSNYRVRDSILVEREEVLSPSKLVLMRKTGKIDEENDSSFGSDRMNRME